MSATVARLKIKLFVRSRMRVWGIESFDNENQVFLGLTQAFLAIVISFQVFFEGSGANFCKILGPSLFVIGRVTEFLNPFAQGMALNLRFWRS
jgi:hypothetical protein